jgi:hypothetical protein
MPVVVLSSYGTEKLVRLATAIKASGDKNLQRELTKAMRRAARPLLRSARQGAIQILPYRGGLADTVAASRFASQVRANSKGAALRITAQGRYQLSSMDAGHVRHPVYGHRTNWVSQRIRPGWFTKPLTIDAPKQRQELDRAVYEVAQQLEAEGG